MGAALSVTTKKPAPPMAMSVGEAAAWINPWLVTN